MAYRVDPDLEFFRELSSQELEPLVHVLTYDKDNKKRITESITSDSRYKLYSPDHKKYWDLIAEEIQRYGGNSLVNILRRGKGVLYKEILCDVSDKAKLNYNKKSTTEQIELNLLQKILIDAVEKMDESSIKKVVEELDIKTNTFTSQAVAAALQIALRNNIYLIGNYAYIIFNSIATQVLGRALLVTTNIVGARLLAVFTGPIGWALTGLWTAIDIAGPAFRVTTPAVVLVACLRQMQKQKNEYSYQI